MKDNKIQVKSSLTACLIRSDIVSPYQSTQCKLTDVRLHVFHLDPSMDISRH